MNDPDQEDIQMVVMLGCMLVIGATILALGIVKLAEVVKDWF